jgi:hypothetical protein
MYDASETRQPPLPGSRWPRNLAAFVSLATIRNNPRDRHARHVSSRVRYSVIGMGEQAPAVRRHVANPFTPKARERKRNFPGASSISETGEATTVVAHSSSSSVPRSGARSCGSAPQPMHSNPSAASGNPPGCGSSSTASGNPYFKAGVSPRAVRKVAFVGRRRKSSSKNHTNTRSGFMMIPL